MKRQRLISGLWLSSICAFGVVCAPVVTAAPSMASAGASLRAGVSAQADAAELTLTVGELFAGPSIDGLLLAQKETKLASKSGKSVKQLRASLQKKPQKSKVSPSKAKRAKTAS